MQYVMGFSLLNITGDVLRWNAVTEHPPISSRKITFVQIFLLLSLCCVTVKWLHLFTCSVGRKLHRSNKRKNFNEASRGLSCVIKNQLNLVLFMISIRKTSVVWCAFYLWVLYSINYYLISIKKHFFFAGRARMTDHRRKIFRTKILVSAGI